ncbi:MAG: HDOD domain-containing protein [Myxococcales bacterium]|nr:HDOD domain-containing protein [Myxococcales bacterium]
MAAESPIEDLKRLVLQRVAADQLTLPSMPMVAAKALQTLRTPNGSLAATAQVLENDPLVSARVLRIANSAAYATRESALSIAQAVSRLGTRTLETVLVEVSAQGVFASRNRDINAACQRLWEHSLATGLVARDLALLVFGTAGQEFAQAAFLAGLLHDIGKPVLAAVMLETEKKMASSGAAPRWLPMQTWLELIAGAHRTVGLLVAAKWEMPALVRRGMTDLDTYEDAEPHSMRNFVRLANVLVKRQGLYEGLSQGDLDGAVQQGCLLLSLDPALVENALAGIAERVRQRIA